MQGRHTNSRAIGPIGHSLAAQAARQKSWPKGIPPLPLLRLVSGRWTCTRPCVFPASPAAKAILPGNPEWNVVKALIPPRSRVRRRLHPALSHPASPLMLLSWSMVPGICSRAISFPRLEASSSFHDPCSWLMLQFLHCMLQMKSHRPDDMSVAHAVYAGMEWGLSHRLTS